MDEVAIQFEKLNLSEDSYVFKPLGVIRGKLDEDNYYFKTESGMYCTPIDGYDINASFYYFAPTTLPELKKYYGDEAGDEALLENYLSIAMETCYIGIYDANEGYIKVKQIPIYDNFNSEVDSEFGFFITPEYIESLMDLDTLKDLRTQLNSLLKIAENRGKTQEVIDLKLDKETSKKFSLKELRKEVLSKIIGEDKAVNDITRALMVNYTSNNPRHKSHIMVAGPTGTGKTEIVNIASKYFKVPCAKVDATAYTKEGYVGKSVYSMLLRLIDEAGGDINKAQNGILIIDEIDKKFKEEDRFDVGGKAVLNSLLKILDRDKIEIDKGLPGTHDVINFDTSNLTVICMGAFEDLFSQKEKEANRNSIGFTSEKTTPKNVVITKDDIRKYGDVSEFIGRFNEFTQTNKLSLEDNYNILKNSEISPIKEEEEYFADLGVKVKFTSGYIKQIAIKNSKMSEGARGLKSLVKETLTHAYEEVLKNGNKIKTLKITKETALDPKKYYVNS